MSQNQNIGLLGQYLTVSNGNITISSNVTLASGSGSSDTSNISMLIGNVANLQVGLSGSNTNIVMLTGNIANLQVGISGANTNINTVQSNLVAYATYANSTFSGGGGVNQNAAYSWTNVHTFSNTITINAVSANGSLGTAGQVLSSTGTDTQWVDAAAGGGFSNNQSIAVSSLYYSSATINKLYTYYNNTTFSLDTIFI